MPVPRDSLEHGAAVTWRERMWPATGAIVLVLLVLGAVHVARPFVLLWVLIGWFALAVVLGLLRRS